MVIIMGADIMTKRTVRVLLILIPLVVHIRGTPLYAKDGAFPSNLGKLQYNPNMTSLWVLDNRGWLSEAYLHGKPPEAEKNLESSETPVSFYLYTLRYNGPYQLIMGDTNRLNSSTFDPSCPIKVIIHGFWNSFQSDSVQVSKEAYFRWLYDFNIIAVDWSKGAAGPWYTVAVGNTKGVGKQVAAMIDFLVTCGANISSFHLIGHSLGAHIAAFAANNVKSGTIERISGLDAALPLFHLRPPEDRLDPTDAQVVDCIHTCGGYLGFYTPLCSMDFYPNGGTSSQPPCNWDFTGACSHSMSFRYFSASVAVNFTAVSCSSFDDVKRKRCNGGRSGTMGEPALQSEPGIYYLETSSSYPYAQS